MINWQIIGQLLATGVIMLSGPAVIVLLALKRVIFNLVYILIRSSI